MSTVQCLGLRTNEPPQIHSLLDTERDLGSLHDDVASINFQKRKHTEDVELDGIAELAPLIGQFRDHLESMRSNAEQVEGLDDGIGRATATLEDAFRGHISRSQNALIFDST